MGPVVLDVVLFSKDPFIHLKPHGCCKSYREAKPKIAGRDCSKLKKIPDGGNELQ